jgi:two-component system OmpR family sensor kinase
VSQLATVRDWAYTRLHNLSLTARLVSVVVLLTLAAFVVTTTLTAYLLRDYLTDRTDAELENYLDPLAASAVAQLTDRPDPGDEYLPSTPFYLVITDRETGRAWAWTPSNQEIRPELTSVRWDDPRFADGSFYFTVGTDGSDGQWRVLADRHRSGQLTVAIAVPLGPVQNTVKQLVLLSSIVGLCTLAAVALLGWFAVRRSFRPLARIEDTARAIAAGDLTSRIPPRDAHDEVASLSDSLNTMLARIEHSFAVRQASERRMRQFVADASHELRTPLATVKGYAELYRVGGVRDPEDVAGAMGRIENEAGRMARLVEDLLLLTRVDSQPTTKRSDIDLTVLAADTVQDARVRADGREIRLVPLRDGGIGGVHTTGDDHALRQVLANLVTNALEHTPPGSPVEVAVGALLDRAVIEVRDHGPGIPPDVADRVFERFYRADASRNRSRGGGAGLGLAIVAAIVGRHRGAVRHLPTPGGGATFRIELPLTSRVGSAVSQR